MARSDPSDNTGWATPVRAGGDDGSERASTSDSVGARVPRAVLQTLIGCRPDLVDAPPTLDATTILPQGLSVGLVLDLWCEATAGRTWLPYYRTSGLSQNAVLYAWLQHFSGDLLPRPDAATGQQIAAFMKKLVVQLKRRADERKRWRAAAKRKAPSAAAETGADVDSDAAAVQQPSDEDMLSTLPAEQLLADARPPVWRSAALTSKSGDSSCVQARCRIVCKWFDVCEYDHRHTLISPAHCMLHTAAQCPGRALKAGAWRAPWHCPAHRTRP